MCDQLSQWSWVLPQLSYRSIGRWPLQHCGTKLAFWIPHSSIVQVLQKKLAEFFLGRTALDTSCYTGPSCPGGRNSSVENQLLELKDANTSQILDFRGLNFKVRSLEKSIFLIEEELSKLDNELNKEKKNSSTQTGNEQKADKGLQNKEKSLSHLTHISACSPVPKFGSDPPRHAIHAPAVLLSQQKSSKQKHKYSISGNKTINISGQALTKTNPTAKRTASDVSPPRTVKRPRLDTASADPANTAHKTQSLISSALETVQKFCYDVLPTDRIHALLKGTSDLPVLKDEEKHVISEFCVNESSAQTFLSVILNKIKAERESMGPDLLQSFCRVYVGMCKQRRDHHKAHALAYRFLKEEFPDSTKLIMAMVTAWPSLFSIDSPLCRAIHIVSKLKARGNILDLLSKYLHWNEEPPENIYSTINSTMRALLEDSSLTFQKNSRLGQLGLKENLVVSVRNLLKGIHDFGNQKLSKDLPWEVQLAMVYATHDLAPSNPKVALKTVESWRQKIRQPVPLAVTKCLKQIGFLCHQNN
ncbi:little elongation complex subunit 1 [Silurus meridionalis]|nr:little elongation complex subunit 1 [Silurus meridionalis]